MTVNVFSFRRSHNLHCKCPAALCKNSSASPHPKDLAKLSDLTNLDFSKIRRFPFLSYLLGWGRVTSLWIWPKTCIGTGTRKAHSSRWKGKESTKPPACFLWWGESMFMFSVVYRFWVRGKTNFQQFFSRWMSRRSWTWSPFCRVFRGGVQGERVTGEL